MRPTVSIARKLIRLMQGESLPHSQLKQPLTLRMIDEGVLAVRSTGSRRSVYCHDVIGVQRYLVNHFGIGDLSKFVAAAMATELQRSEAVRVATDTKFKAIRSFKGFLVNSLQPLDTQLDGVPFEASACPGTFTYIHDFEKFTLAADITVVGVENGENFRYIERQQGLFHFAKILFVSRYPQSGDLLAWLQSIPNSYVHFGDYDFAGINIYLNEFKQHLGSQAQFFVPKNLAGLMVTYGNRELYQRQFCTAPKRCCLPEPALVMLWDLICAEKKGLEQEVFIAAAG